MTKSEIRKKLIAAQNILDEVYEFACADSSLSELERTMSAADTCIVVAVELVGEMKD